MLIALNISNLEKCFANDSFGSVKYCSITLECAYEQSLILYILCALAMLLI